jgi:hypothetical protein
MRWPLQLQIPLACSGNLDKQVRTIALFVQHFRRSHGFFYVVGQKWGKLKRDKTIGTSRALVNWRKEIGGSR